MLYAVIMAGGVGSRFWPYSRQAQPKQFLSVLSEESLIQATLGRLSGVIAPQNAYVLTHERYVTQTANQLPAVPQNQILAEPISKNTAPCIAYAAIELLKKDKDATMVVLPADHLISNVKQFHEVLKVAEVEAQKPNTLVTIGIQPTHPETGYGYIQFEAGEGYVGEIKAYAVKNFAEKPDLETAKSFLASGDFLWNSGMFIWRADTILAEMQKYMPDLVEAFAEIAATTDVRPEMTLAAFQASPKESIDYGIMEKAETVKVVPGNFGWNDVGDWRAVQELSPEKDDAGNAVKGNVLIEDSKNSLVFTDEKLIALVGLEDVMVVNTPDAILVCHKDKAQKVKNVVDYFNLNNLNEYL